MTQLQSAAGVAAGRLLWPRATRRRPLRPSAPRNIRQLTFGGENAEAYFSPDGTQADLPAHARAARRAIRSYTMKIDGSDLHRVSTGTGRTTCGYFYPGGNDILFASTHKAGVSCPPKPTFEHGYVWPVYDSYDIYRANADGSNLRPLTTTAGYDAEATIAPDGTVAFTSVRDGDMEIYTMRGDGSDVRRLTTAPGPTAARSSRGTAGRSHIAAHPLQPGPELTIIVRC